MKNEISGASCLTRTDDLLIRHLISFLSGSGLYLNHVEYVQFRFSVSRLYTQLVKAQLGMFMHNNKLCLASTELAEFFNTSFLVKLQFMNHKSAALPTVLTKHIIIYTLMYIRFQVILKYFLLREGEILFTLSILILRVCKVKTERCKQEASVQTRFH